MSGARSKVSHFSPTFSNQNLYFKKGDIINEKKKIVPCNIVTYQGELHYVIFRAILISNET